MAACCCCSGCSSRRARRGCRSRSIVFGLMLGILLISQFWTLANDIYDPRQARRLFGFIGGGASLGGAMGAALTAFVVDEVGTDNLLLVSAAVLGAVRRRSSRSSCGASRRRRRAAAIERSAASAAAKRSALLRGSRHLQMIALVIAFAAHRRRHHRAAAQHGGRGDQGRRGTDAHHGVPGDRSRSTCRSSASSSRSA